MSKIEWTEKTWNPIVGCSIESSGCKNCYAMRTAHRLEAINETTGKTPQYAGTTKTVKGKAVWTGKIGAAPDRVWEEPLRRKKPTTYFVNSMGDLFHPNVADELIDRAFAVMALAPQHRFQVLTKHPKRMREWFESFDRDMNFEPDDWPEILNIRQRVENDDDVHRSQIYHDETGRLENALYSEVWPLPNVHLGTSIEDQPTADLRIPELLATPAAVQFISAEPLLGGVNLDVIPCPRSNDKKIRHPEKALIGALLGRRSYDTARGRRNSPHEALDWVIVGGESGPGARPMHPEWVRSIRDQCAEADVPFFFKQWGEWIEHDHHVDGPTVREYSEETEISAETKIAECSHPGFVSECGKYFRTWDDITTDRARLMDRVGKKLAGRTLDGRIHDETPEELS